MGHYLQHGGQNQTHGTVENCPRIDSFDIRERFDGIIETGGDIVLDFWHTMIGGCYGGYDEEYVDLGHPASDWGITINMERVQSGFGGSRVYWVCPCCGQRVRFLYFTKQTFQCRSCSNINYRSQQRTRDSVAIYEQGLKYAREKLRYDPPPGMCPAEFPGVLPPKPKGMHHATYMRHLVRFQKYQNEYLDKFLLEACAILRRMPK